MGLLVGPLLQPVFNGAQENVGLIQGLPQPRRDEALFFQNRQHLANGPDLQGRFHAPANQLKHLPEKFDFANAARTQLDVVLEAFVLHLQSDAPFHFTQAVKSPEIEIAPIDKGFEPQQELVARDVIAPHHARFDQGVTFPLAPLFLVIILDGVKTHHQRPGIAVRPQAGVHAENETVGRGRADELNQVARHFHEKFLRGDRTFHATGRLTAVAVCENQIHVRGKIQLAGTQFPQAENDQLLRTAVAVRGGAPLAGRGGIGKGQSPIDTAVGQAGQIRQGLLQIRPAADVPNGDAHHFTPPESAHRLHYGRTVGGRIDFGRQIIFARLPDRRRPAQPCFDRRVQALGDDLRPIGVDQIPAR